MKRNDRCPEMEAAFSPIVKKIAGEVLGKRKRDFRAPTDYCVVRIRRFSSKIGGCRSLMAGRA